jgi:uncharacterized protein
MASTPPADDPGALLGPRRLSDQVVVLWRLRAAIWAASLVLVVATLTGLVTGSPVATLTATLAAVLVAAPPAWRLPALAHSRWQYELTDATIELRHGVVLHVESSIPHFRVQHVDIRQGPVERWLGIARLEIASASTSTDAAIPGVEAARADAVRRHILERAETTEGV